MLRAKRVLLRSGSASHEADTGCQERQRGGGGSLSPRAAAVAGLCCSRSWLCTHISVARRAVFTNCTWLAVAVRNLPRCPVAQLYQGFWF